MTDKELSQLAAKLRTNGDQVWASLSDELGPCLQANPDEVESVKHLLVGMSHGAFRQVINRMDDDGVWLVRRLAGAALAEIISQHVAKQESAP